MAQPLYRPVAPLPTPSSMLPRQKKDLQKEYRNKEIECFKMLRDVINQLTGDELQTRQEILRKAIDLLLTASEIRRLGDARNVYPALQETGALSVGNASSAPMGNEPSHWSSSWRSTLEPNAQTAYYSHQSHDQHSMYDTDAAFNEAMGFDEDWSQY